MRIGLAALAAGAVTTSAVAVSLLNTSGAAADAADSDISSLQESRDERLSGAVNAFTSRSGQRADQAQVSEAASARSTALSQTTHKVEDASTRAAASGRQSALQSRSSSITKEEARRKAEGWEPGGKNPSFLRPVKGGSLTSPFGGRVNPVTGASESHSGQDIALGCGSPIYAPQDGTVSYVGWMGSGGNALKIDHGKYNGKEITSGYYHAQGYTVSQGQKVTRGQVVGYVGTTGTSTGCHLHYMIFENGINVNPVPYL
jgi:murein DD-endopeptidase MepM/ murein hydrolase activator NlpD